MNAIPLSLTCTLKQSDTLLRIDYLVENTRNETLFVRVRGALLTKPSRRPYSFLRSDPLRLFLSYQEAIIPPLIEVYVPLTPPAVRLEPGEKYEDFAEIDVPVEEWHPYGPVDYPLQPEPVEVQDIEFVTEYLRQQDVTSTSVYRHEAGLYVAVGEHSQRLSGTFRTPAPFTVLRRADDFFRY